MGKAKKRIEPIAKLINDLMAFEILENRLKCCKACYCVGIDANGKPFKIVHGDQKDIAELLEEDKPSIE